MNIEVAAATFRAAAKRFQVRQVVGAGRCAAVCAAERVDVVNLNPNDPVAVETSLLRRPASHTGVAVTLNSLPPCDRPVVVGGHAFMTFLGAPPLLSSVKQSVARPAPLIFALPLAKRAGKQEFVREAHAAISFPTPRNRSKSSLLRRAFSEWGKGFVSECIGRSCITNSSRPCQ